MSSQNHPQTETEPEMVERKLLESQDRLAGIIDSAMDAIITIDEDQRIILFNAAAERMFGYPSRKILGASLDLLLPETYRRIHQKHIQRFGRTGITNRAMGRQKTLKALRSNGQEFPVEASISQIQTSDGKLFSVILRDVTERVGAEEQLRENEQNLRATFEQAPIGIVHVSPDGAFLRANQKMCEICGCKLEELLPKSTAMVTPANYWEKEQELVRQLLDGQIDTYTMEKQYLRQDGSLIWINLTASLVRNIIGAPRYIIQMIEDISERKSIETALRNHAERIDALNAQTEKRLHLLTALRTIDLAISSSLDLRVTLKIILDQVVVELDVDAANILLFDPSTQTLEFAAGRGTNTELMEGSHILLGTGFAGTAAYEQKSILIPDLSDVPVDPARADLFSIEGIQSYGVTPLLAKGEVKGVLEVYGCEQLTADAEWVSFFEALAGQAAIAIDSAQLFDNLQRSNQQLLLAYNATIEGWSRALDLRDKETEGHTQRVTEMTLQLAKKFNGQFSDEEIVHIRRGALLHDIGKMGVPDTILLKPDSLTDSEWEVMHRHPDYAYQLLYPIVYLRKALDIPHYHHERFDGSGYPQGLKGEQIPLAARIFAVVDVWDALRSDRPYRTSWPEEKVIEYIRKCSGTAFDPMIVDVFLEVVRNTPQRNPSN